MVGSFAKLANNDLLNGGSEAINPAGAGGWLAIVKHHNGAAAIKFQNCENGESRNRKSTARPHQRGVMEHNPAGSPSAALFPKVRERGEPALLVPFRVPCCAGHVVRAQGSRQAVRVISNGIGRLITAAKQHQQTQMRVCSWRRGFGSTRRCRFFRLACRVRREDPPRTFQTKSGHRNCEHSNAWLCHSKFSSMSILPRK